MDCREAQERIIESLEEPQLAAAQPLLDAHLKECPACAEFVRMQLALDQRLQSLLTPPALGPGFRPALRRRIRREAVRQWPDALPEVVHFLSCGAATVLCAFLLPFDKASILAAGGAVTVAAYVVLMAVRRSFELVEDSD